MAVTPTGAGIADVIPSARVGRRVRESPETSVSPVRALAGAAVAVAGVALGIGAVLALTAEPDAGLPTVAAPPAVLVNDPPLAVPAEPSAPTAFAPSAPMPPSATTPPTTPAPTTPPPTTPPPPADAAPARPALTVLNNSTRAGLADRAATEFRTGGWPVRRVGNFTGRIGSTTVYFPPGQRVAAERLAGAYDLPRVLPRFDGLPGSGLTVVITRDFSA